MDINTDTEPKHEVKLIYWDPEDVRRLREIGYELSKNYKPPKKSIWRKFIDFLLK